MTSEITNLADCQKYPALRNPRDAGGGSFMKIPTLPRSRTTHSLRGLVNPFHQLTLIGANVMAVVWVWRLNRTRLNEMKRNIYIEFETVFLTVG